MASTDVPRRVAFDLLRAVAAQGAYANLRLPQLISAAGLTGRDAALATELSYGTLRTQGTLDEIAAACVDRMLSAIDAPVLDLLRLGAYQLLCTRIPAHAAVATTVDLARATGNGRAAGFLNAVLRRIAGREWEGWTAELGAHRSALGQVALRTAHPQWIAAVFVEALDGDFAEGEAALEADNARPHTDLVALPGRITRAELATQARGDLGRWSPYAVRLAGGGDPGALSAVREHRAAVQDEGSQLCALAFAEAPLEGRDERWLDMCAGPGGKTALLAAIAARRGARVTANELHPHRAELVRRTIGPGAVEVVVGDARSLPQIAGGYDRVLLDAPCSGLGALRRRPEARWRRRPSDVGELSRLQLQLLASALRLVRPGGLVGYVVCSPHRTETTELLSGHRLVDARPCFREVPLLGNGPTVQLWPHRHGTDALFCALLSS